MQKIYFRKVWSGGLKLLQLVILSKVISLSNACRLDGGNRKWHFEIKNRNETAL